MELLIGTNKGFSLDFKPYIVKVTLSILLVFVIDIISVKNIFDMYLTLGLLAWYIINMKKRRRTNFFLWEVRQSPNTSETNIEGCPI